MKRTTASSRPNSLGLMAASRPSGTSAATRTRAIPTPTTTQRTTAAPPTPPHYTRDTYTRPRSPSPRPLATTSPLRSRSTHLTRFFYHLPQHQALALHHRVHTSAVAGA
ncbi:hypothetical protein PLICRDRAFT_445540 [Plicaturopsis crispa FD-325 SS-3]|uniref:Uncharacterized protein n=1 Tax=Plicaturopsis crispa FD-325 SS-3 TaxID=944288 RepID=A0A0C9T680_PLICR|nr:hypothetical protein PLICRDRAFT_445540 [Plicaturopsis crispa FD-325 SS-3]